MGPFPHPDGHDDPGLFDEAVPCVTAMVEDILIGREDSIREPVVADELPGILDRVELGRFRRQEQKRDVVRHLEGF